MQTESTNRCHYCGRYENKTDEYTESFVCEACDTRVENKQYAGHGQKLDKVAESIEEAAERIISKVPEETVKAIEAERRKQRKNYILTRLLIAIAGGVVLQFIIRFFVV